MNGKAGPLSLDRLWLVMAALAMATCAALPVVLATAPAWLDESDRAAGSLAAICVEAGRNVAGRYQVGLWWEAVHTTAAIPGVPPVRSLRVLCGTVPWSAALPTRATFIHTQ